MANLFWAVCSEKSKKKKQLVSKIVHCVTRGRSVCFYGEEKHFPNRRNDLPRVTHDTFFDIPMISVFFVPVGRFRNYVFRSCRAEGKHWFASSGVDIYILRKELIAPNFGFSSQVRKKFLKVGHECSILVINARFWALMLMFGHSCSFFGMNA